MSDKGIGKRILLYTLTPGILPRIRNFPKNSFSNLAYLIALVFNAVRILPSTHPFLQRGNANKYGVMQVLIETARIMEFSWKRIDHVIIFFSIVIGIVLLALQFIILLTMAFTGVALAAPPIPFADFFVIPAASYNTDIAMRLLHMVFGLPNLFGNRADGVLPAFHDGLHSMFAVYSWGLLVVAAIILAYFVISVVAETAHTGTPFGKRFNHAWAPLRLVAGIGLLIPLASGLNSAQYITLYAAKFGSNFATNGWILFNERITETYLGDPESLIGIPNTPEMMHLPAFMMLAHACDYGEEELHGRTIDGFIVTTTNNIGEATLSFNSTYAQALEFSDNKDIFIRFGMQSPEFTDQKGFVMPYCGELQLTTSALDPESGAYVMQEAYYNLVQAWWYNSVFQSTNCSGDGGFLGNGDFFAGLERALYVGLLDIYGASYIRFFTSVENRFLNEPIVYDINNPADIPGLLQGALPTINGGLGNVGLPAASFKQIVYENMLADVASCIQEAADADREDTDWEVTQQMRDLGWAGAAIWYNKIAELNGALASGTQAVPRPTMYPAVMEYTMEEKLQQDDNIDPRTRFCPEAEQGRDIRYHESGDEELANTCCIIQDYWESDGYRVDQSSTHTQVSGNAMTDGINSIFGTQGLFDMCQNTNIHPLAQLAIAGKTLIENSIRNMGFSVASGAMGGLAYIFQPHAGAVGMAVGGVFSGIAGIGLSIGFILFYVIPLMPFIYFFFAVGGWIKGLFEAMVGVPLWALAHLRIDGDGMPGDAAGDGYFLIFEVFARPIMTLIGLFASILIFSAMVKALNDTFFLVISNLSGFNTNNAVACGITEVSNLNRIHDLNFFRSAVDEFFFTIVYAIIVYMIGMSCFKLVDAIPNQIMRWMGENVKTFNDEAGEPAEGLVQMVAVGSRGVGDSMKQAGDNLRGLADSAGGALADTMSRSDLEGRHKL